MSPCVLVVQHEDDDPIHLMGGWMPGVELDVCRPYLGDAVPAAIEEYAGLVVMGGVMGAYDDEVAAWLPAVRELVRSAAEAGVPTLGICLGNQLCAVALGGEVVVNPHGRQFGLFDIGWTAEAADDELVGGLVGPRRAVHWNDDVVARLPEGGVRLATASDGTVQAGRYAPTVWGIQWHPEVDAEIIAKWAEEGDLEQAEKTRLIDDLVRAEADLTEWWRPLAERFAELVGEP